MTLEQFLDELRKTPRDWEVRKTGSIRRQHGNLICCPISALDSPNPSRSDSYFRVAKDLRLSDHLITRIVHATDRTPGYDQDLRRQLLEATDLA